MKNITLRRLTSTVTNPNYEEWCRDKESERRFRTIDAGEVVKHRTFGDGRDYVEHHRTALSPGLSTLIVSASEIVQPQNLREVLEAHDMTEYLAFEALDRLIEGGAVEIDKVVSVCRSMRAEYEDRVESVDDRADRPARPLPRGGAT